MAARVLIHDDTRQVRALEPARRLPTPVPHRAPGTRSTAAEAGR